MRKKRTEYEIVGCPICGRLFVASELELTQRRRYCSGKCSHEAQSREKDHEPEVLVHVDGGEGHDGFDLAPEVAERLIKLRNSVQFINHRTKTTQHQDYVQWLASLDR